MTYETRKTWLVVGSSPSAPDCFDRAFASADISITTNAGWQLFLTASVVPDCYWISDPVSCRINGRAMRFMQERGTRIVTMHKDERSSIEMRGLAQADEFITLPARQADAPGFVRGRYVHPRLSGLICLQYAINNGASRVLLVGMDGYRSSAENITADTFDGRAGKAASAGHTHDWIAPFIQSMAVACPDVEFVICGKPLYRVEASNVQMFREQLPAYGRLLRPAHRGLIERSSKML